MTTRTKLEIPINQPITVELLFDEPISGTSKYGSYNMYAVLVDDQEFTYFPTEEVHDKLKNLKKGDSATITKLAAQRGSKLVTVYEVKQVGKEVVTAPKNIIETHVDEEPHQEEEELEEKYSAANDNFYEVMLQCYEDALKMQRELNGLVDPEKIAVTLFIARTKR